MSAARKTMKVVRVAEGGPIFEILRDIFLLVGSVSSTIFDHLQAIRADEARQTALMERMAEVIAPTDEQMRTRLLLAQEARSFEPDLDDLAPVRERAS